MTAREAALQALLRCHRGGAWSDAVLDGILQRGGLDRRDAALATRICYGVQQNRTYLDFVLEKWCRQPLRKLEPVILELLRLSAYQLLFLDKIPASAVVDEAVKLAQESDVAVVFAGLPDAFESEGFDRVNPSILQATIQSDYPDFDERQIGFKRFSDVMKELEKQGLLVIEMDEAHTMLLKIC